MVFRHAIFRLSSEQQAHRPLRWLLLLTAIVSLAAKAPGQDAAPSNTPGSDDPALTLFDHPSTARWWVSGQMNFIGQGHGSFPAEYSGTNSLKDTPEFAVSQVLTLYTGYELTPNLQVLADIEIAAGHGISNALGVAGFTNLDVVRNPDLSKAPYLARGILRYTIPLSDDKVEAERSWLDLRTEVPARRVEILAGKFSMPDFFDLNDVGTDSHLQFMNWCDDQNGAWDYAANTRGYTDGAIVQYISPLWAVRFGLALMPKVANGLYLDADIARARGDNLEFEFHPSLLRRRASTVRLLSYVNHANMGKYREAIDQFREGLVPVPDITAVREQGRVKYGFGVNLEQDLPAISKASHGGDGATVATSRSHTLRSIARVK